MREEISGVLNWMIEGYYKLKASNWQFKLTPEQQQRVDDLLQHSQTIKQFIASCVSSESERIVLSQEMYLRYQNFCATKLWKPVAQNKFAGLAEKEIAQRFGIKPRHDLNRGDSGAQKGWKGIRLI